jgi:hypothetical protein
VLRDRKRKIDSPASTHGTSGAEIESGRAVEGRDIVREVLDFRHVGVPGEETA